MIPSRKNFRIQKPSTKAVLNIICAARLLGSLICILLAVKAYYANKLFDKAKLPSPPYLPGIQNYVRALHVMGWVLLGVNFFGAFVPAILSARSWYDASTQPPSDSVPLFSFLDLGITIALFFLLAKMKRFVPMNCDSRWNDYGIMPGQDMIRTPGIYVKAPYKACHFTSIAWKLGLVESIVSLIITVAGFSTGFGREGLYMRLTNRLVISNVRFVTRWRQKKIASSPDLEMGELILSRQEAGSINQSTQLLNKLLEENDILRRIADRCHFIDIAHLSQTCRTLNNTLSPAKPLLRSHCCASNPGGRKLKCWACNIPVCTDCRWWEQPKVAETTMDLHLVNCSPRCSKCYYLYQCRDFSEQQSLLSNILATQSCQCRASNPQLFWDDSTSDSLSIQEFECARTLCGDCGRGMARTSDGDALSAARIKMLEKRLRRMNNEMDTCAHCRQTLKPGPRWWVCKSCTKECGDAVHVQWAGGNRWQLLKWRAMRNSKATAVEQDAAPPAQAE